MRIGSLQLRTTPLCNARQLPWRHADIVLSREAHHYRVIQSLALTIGADAKLVSRLDAFRKKRNIGDYERSGLVSEKEAEEIAMLARQLRKDVENWLRKNHSHLI